MNDIKYIILKSNIYKRTLLGNKRLLPEHKQIVKHVIGTNKLVKETEDKFMRECQIYVELLNSKNLRARSDKDGNITKPVYTAESFTIIEPNMPSTLDRMIFPIEIYDYEYWRLFN